MNIPTCICWIKRSRAIKVPDRPTPALQWTTMGLWSVETRSRKDRTKRIKVVGGSGTPKSGHVLKWKWRIIRLESPWVFPTSHTMKSFELKKQKCRQKGFFLLYTRGTRKLTNRHSGFRSGWLPKGKQDCVTFKYISKYLMIMYLNISVINRLGVEWPIAVALFSTLFYTTSEHDNCTCAGLPSHSPEIVACRM